MNRSMVTENCFLRDDIARLWSPENALEAAFALQGEIYREVPGRRTMRVELGGSSYFVKLHYGVGWDEVLKNWLQFKQPVLGAGNEFAACRGLAEERIRAPIPAAFGSKGINPAARRSFILCDELQGFTSLEELTEEWQTAPPDPLLKRRLLYAVAGFARNFHQRGFIHRDFYICHLLADDVLYASGKISLAVLDLHRARRFSRVPQRWLKRDLAALLFSSLDLGYSRRDWLRFVRLYTGRPLREIMSEQGDFWQAVCSRAEKLYDEGLRKDVVTGRYRS